MKKLFTLALLLLFPILSWSASNVMLLWDAPSGATVAGYNVYRATTMGGPYTKLNTAIVTATSYVDMNTPSSVVFYTVKSVNSTGIESNPTSELRVDLTQPPPPTNLRLGGITVVDLFVNGTKVASGPADVPLKYTIPRQTPARPYNLIVTGQ